MYKIEIIRSILSRAEYLLGIMGADLFKREFLNKPPDLNSPQVALANLYLHMARSIRNIVSEIDNASNGNLGN